MWEKSVELAGNWESLGASPELVDALRRGVQPDITCPVAPYDMGGCWLEGEQLQAWEELKTRYLAMSAIKVVDRLDYCNKAFLEPKPKGGFRLVVDLRPFNAHNREYPTEFDHIYSLAQSLEPKDRLASFDLKDGYFHMYIHPDYQKYFGFRVNGVNYVHVALPFGWNGSPAWFMRLSRQVGAWMACPPTFSVGGTSFGFKQSIRHRVLLDDFLMMFRAGDDAEGAVTYTQALLSFLGLEANEKKSHWEVTQVIEHLGLIVDTLQGRFVIPEGKVQAIRACAKSVLSEVAKGARWVPTRLAARMAGLSVCVSLAFTGARLYAQGLYDSLKGKSGWYGKVRLSHQAVKDVRALAKFPARWNGAPIWTPAGDVQLVSDASDVGWGALVKVGSRTLGEAQGRWSSYMAGQHIMVRETAAIRLGLRAFLPACRGKVVETVVDNSASYYGVRHWASRSQGLMLQLRKIFSLCDREGITLAPRLVKSAANPADSLSRFKRDAEWSLRENGFSLLEGLYGPHSVDLFAQAENAKVGRFFSMLGEDGAIGSDALQQCWEGENAYAAPPWKLISKVLDKLAGSQGLSCTLVVPDLPGSLWYAKALGMAAVVRSMPLVWSRGQGRGFKCPCLVLRVVRPGVSVSQARR
jgi:hypothetical protein